MKKPIYEQPKSYKLPELRRLMAVFSEQLAEEHGDALSGEPVPVIENPLEAADVLEAVIDVPGNTSMTTNSIGILPMEGRDCDVNGMPTDLTNIRADQFGGCGASWILGGEAIAVNPIGLGDPLGMRISEKGVKGLKNYVSRLRKAIAYRNNHGGPVGNAKNVLIFAQLTLSGAHSYPNKKGPANREPKLFGPDFHRDKYLGITPDPSMYWTDEELSTTIPSWYGEAADAIAEAGFDGFDAKLVHDYNSDRSITAFGREGDFGGNSFENRTRFAMLYIEEMIRRQPQLRRIARMTATHVVPHVPTSAATAAPMDLEGKPFNGWGIMDRMKPTKIDYSEPFRFGQWLVDRGFIALNPVHGDPYCSSTFSRSSVVQPPKSYPPHEDPIKGAVRAALVCQAFQKQFPETLIYTSGLSGLQNHLAAVGAGMLRDGWARILASGRGAIANADNLTRLRIDGAFPKFAESCAGVSMCTGTFMKGKPSVCIPRNKKATAAFGTEERKEFTTWWNDGHADADEQRGSAPSDFDATPPAH